MKNRIKPGPGQESVWDYPRPPKLEAVRKHLRVWWKDELIADSNQTYRVLETSHPPVYYFPTADIKMDLLEQDDGGRSFCEWKGIASYWHIITPKGNSLKAGWSYEAPSARFADIAGYIAFYPSRVSKCTVDDELVQAQAGDFYGGWITKNIVGPFKGEPGTWGW
ncbi:MAG: DUF427 domain-containing protein [Bacteroidota bacterium]